MDRGRHSQFKDVVVNVARSVFVRRKKSCIQDYKATLEKKEHLSDC